MKIIDFEKKGNVVRFCLGADDCEDYHGDDWNDVPYECNAGGVYSEYTVGHRDIVFPLEFSVLEPCDGTSNSRWSKDDMKLRRVPCIIAIKSDSLFSDNFDKMNADSSATRFYFGDKMEPSNTLTVFSGGIKMAKILKNIKIVSLGKDELAEWDLEKIPRLEEQLPYKVKELIYSYYIRGYEAEGCAVYSDSNNKWHIISMDHCSCFGPLEDLKSVPMEKRASS